MAHVLPRSSLISRLSLDESVDALGQRFRGAKDRLIMATQGWLR